MKITDPLNYAGRDLEAMTFSVNYHYWIFEQIQPYLGKKLCEVGAGCGNFSQILVQNVEHLTALEPSNQMFPLLQKYFEHHSQVETIHSTFEQKHQDFSCAFDSMVYVNVLEHIEDDEQELSYIHSALKQRGHVVIFVPALSFLYSDLDQEIGHFRRYHLKPLVRLVEQTGFRIKIAKYFDILGILPWYIVFVLMRSKQSATKVNLYDKIAIPIVKRLENLITPPIGKNILLIAQK